jgi:hypothetical protein
MSVARRNGDGKDDEPTQTKTGPSLPLPVRELGLLS